jgi:hypothetical protein
MDRTAEAYPNLNKLPLSGPARKFVRGRRWWLALLGLVHSADLAETKRRRQTLPRRASSSRTGRGYRYGGCGRRTGRVILQESPEGAATGSISNLTKALKETFG